MRTQADDLKDQIKKLELALYYSSDESKHNELYNKICEAKDILQNIQQMYKLEKYKQNLTIQGTQVWSYSTHVATIANDKLFQLGYWSQTTQKHINYVADQLDLDLIK